MERLDIAKEEIPKFVDPRHWFACFPTLAQQDLFEFGKRPSVCSAKAGQMCADRGRLEGLGPQEYAAIKLKAVD